MGLILAEAPFEEFARDNSPILAVLVCALLALLAVRLVVRNTTRMLLLGILLLTTIFIVSERNNITECSRTCKCEIAGFETSIAYCNPQLGVSDS